MKKPWLLAALCLTGSAVYADCSPSPEETGRKLTEILNSQNPAQAVQAGKLVSIDGLLKRIDLAPDNAQLQAGLKSGMNSGVANLWRQLISPGNIVRTLSVKRQSDGARVLLRIDMTQRDQGVNYLDLELDRQSCVVDWFTYSTATRLSDLLRRLLGMMIDDPGLIGRALGRVPLNKESTAAMVRLAQYNRSKDYPNVYRTLEQLPEEFKRSAEWRLMRVSAAMQFDDKLYREELQALAEKFGDQPQLQFMLVDHYLFRQEPQRAYQALKSLEGSLGRDALLLSLQAGMLTMMGRHADALDACRQAIAQEPDLLYAYQVQLTSALTARDFKTSLAAIDQLAGRFGQVIDPAQLTDEPLYQALLKSPEYAAWRKNNRARPEKAKP